MCVLLIGTAVSLIFSFKIILPACPQLGYVCGAAIGVKSPEVWG